MADEEVAAILPKGPNYRAIVESDIWKTELRPMLEGVATQAMRDVLKAPAGDKTEFAKGYALACERILTLPEHKVELMRLADLERAKQAEDTEEVEDGPRGPAWARNVGRRLGRLTRGRR